MSCEIRQLGNTEVILRCFLFFFLGILSPMFARRTWLQSPAFAVQSGVGRRLLSLPFSVAGVYLECRRNTKFQRKNRAKPAGVVKVDWHIFWRGKRIPWQSLKPAGLISQNSAACALVWLPLAKSHWLIPCQLCEWARLSMFIESLG